MNTGLNVAVLSLYAIDFSNVLFKKEKTFVSTKCKQKICNTKEETKKKKTTPRLEKQ